MDVKNYQDQAGIWFREIVSRQYSALRKLEEEYRKMSKRTWFNCFDVCSGQWILTVQMGRAS